MTTKPRKTADAGPPTQELPAVELPLAPEPAPEPTGPVLLDVGYDINGLLRNEPQDVAVTYALLQAKDPHLSLGRFGYLQFGGGLFYRPIGFDLDQGAVVCTRVIA